MRRNTLVAAFLVVVFAVALGLLLLEPEPLPGRLATGGDDADGGRPAGVSDALPGNEDFDRVPEVERVTDRDDALSSADAAAQGPTILVRAVLAETGEPVSGATVRVLDVPVADRATAEDARFHPPGLHGLLAESPGWRTGPEGTVRVPRPDGLLVADASQGTRYAQLLVDVDRPVDRVTLELAPDVAIRARVVDKGGSPVADVPVALQTRSDRWSRNDMLRTTDADGRVRFEHAQVALRRSDRGEDWLAVTLPGMPDAAVRLDGEDSDLDREHVLRIPDSGSVTVRVLDNDGSPFPRPVEVALRPIPPGQESGDRFSSRQRQGETLAMTDNGIAHFPRVGIGTGVVAVARLDASERPFSAIGEGPQAAGEDVELVLRRDELRPEVRFRLLDPQGQPLVDAEIVVGERSRTNRSTRERTRRVTTDAEGILNYAPRQGPLTPMLERTLELRWHANRTQAAWTGVQDLSFDVPPGISDLGAVTMRPPRLLAAGVVTDPRGAPIGNARVRLYVPREDNRPGRVRWRMYPGGETRSDPSGRFAIEGMPPGTALQLRATHEEFLQSVVDGVEGAEDHQIVLDAGLRLTGRLLVDDPAMHDELMVAFVPESAGQDGRRNWFRGGDREEVEPDGSFDFGSMSEQRGSLQVLDRRSGLVLYEVQGVAPWPVDGIADGRFDPLDLRGLIEQLTVTFIDMERQPVRNARFSITLPGEDDSWWSRTRDGTAKLFSPPGGLDMTVRTDNYRHQVLRGLSGAREIVLVPAVPLRFELQQPGLAGEFQLEVRVRRVQDGPDVDPGTVRMDAAGRGDASASGPGPIHAYLRVRYSGDDGRRTSRYVDFGELGRRLVYEVRDTVSMQVIRLPVTREDVLRAMDR